MKILTCFCCGAEITAPQYFNGKAYGYSCILKVNPQAKRTKKSVYTYAACELVEKQSPIRSIVRLNGKKFEVDTRLILETSTGFFLAIAQGQKPLFKAVNVEFFRPYYDGKTGFKHLKMLIGGKYKFFDLLGNEINSKGDLL